MEEKNSTAQEKQTERKERNSKNLEQTKITLKDGLTVYEGKMAFLIFGAIITLFFALVMYFLRLDISANLTEIITTFILANAGIVGVEKTIDVFKNGSLSNMFNKK